MVLSTPKKQIFEIEKIIHYLFRRCAKALHDQIRSLPNLQQNSFFMVYGGSNISVIMMEKQAHSTFILVVPRDILDFCGLIPKFCEKRVTRLNFLVHVFQGDDLCDIDGKTNSFHVRLNEGGDPG